MKIKDILNLQDTFMKKMAHLRKNASSSDSGETTDEERAEFERKYLMSEEEYQNALEEWENSDCLVHAREEEIANEESRMIEEVLGLAQKVYPNDWQRYVEEIDTKLNQCFSQGMLTSMEFLLWLTNLKTDLEKANKSQVDLSQQIILKKKQKIGNKKKEDEELDL